VVYLFYFITCRKGTRRGEIRIKCNSIYSISTCIHIHTGKKRRSCCRSRYQTQSRLWVETWSEGPHISIRKHARAQICFLYYTSPWPRSVSMLDGSTRLSPSFSAVLQYYMRFLWLFQTKLRLLPVYSETGRGRCFATEIENLPRPHGKVCRHEWNDSEIGIKSTF